MGLKERGSIRVITYYLLLVISCCEVKLITCDIHKMRQSVGAAADYKINATELEQHIMNGLNMKTKPDVSQVSARTKAKALPLFSTILKGKLWQKLEESSP